MLLLATILTSTFRKLAKFITTNIRKLPLFVSDSQ